MILVTGGAGFIGSNFILGWCRQSTEPVVNLDKVTYAGNPANLASLAADARYGFVRGDIADRALVGALLAEHRPRAIVHFAAESHVDRSIHGPEDFIQTNIVGTARLLDQARAYWTGLPQPERDRFRFLNVSTDEVFGSLEPADPPFSEHSAARPNSPYSASKASADHLVRAYHHTYGLPVLTTHCSNNYGPYQFPEKLIPLMILNALEGRPLPVYGDGQQVRDWLYVADHCEALCRVLDDGRVGSTYTIGGRSERTNLDLVRGLCTLLDEVSPATRPKDGHGSLVTFVGDRPGHDRRYAIDSTRIETELGWRPAESFETGLRKTLEWYLDHRAWVDGVTSGAYRDWVDVNYATRGPSEPAGPRA